MDVYGSAMPSNFNSQPASYHEGNMGACEAGYNQMGQMNQDNNMYIQPQQDVVPVSSESGQYEDEIVHRQPQMMMPPPPMRQQGGMAGLFTQRNIAIIAILVILCVLGYMYKDQIMGMFGGSGKFFGQSGGGYDAGIDVGGFD